MNRPRLVVALGGNALLRRGEAAEADTQRRNVAAAASALASLVGEWDVVLTHGNGPQVGLLALEADAYTAVAPYPLDVLGAESQGMIGYLLVQALQNALPQTTVVGLLTQVIVDPGDPAFAQPTKPIGPVYTEDEARALAGEHGWAIAPDGGHFRRVVASPQPRSIVELDAIEELLAAGALVVCCGGGGIPVVRAGRTVRGVEAVIDKDLTAALLAEQLDAERLVLATDVRHVELDWRTPAARPLHRAGASELRALRFAPGSMAPKIEAVCRFVERTDGTAAIGALAEIADLARGRAGTQIESAPVLAAAP
jgi:carbamate kinase